MDIATLRAAVAAAQSPAPVLVPGVPGLGDVHVRVSTALQAEHARRIRDGKASSDAAAGIATGRMIATFLCDETGELAFDPESDEDATALANLTEQAIHRLIVAATEANFPDLEKGATSGNA